MSIDMSRFPDFTEEEVKRNTWEFMLAFSPRALNVLEEVVSILEMIHTQTIDREARGLSERAIRLIESEGTWGKRAVA